MPEDQLTLIASTVGICLLLTLANVILAAKKISPAAATAFAIAFALTGIAWSISPRVIRSDYLVDGYLLLVNALGAVGTTAIWCGFWLRAGFAVNGWLMAALTLTWLAPVAGILALGWTVGTHVPFAMLSVATGMISSVWRLHKKQGKKNAGDYALVMWLLLILPVAAYACLLSIDDSRSQSNAAWLFYLGFIPTMLTGVGLFTLLGFTLEAVDDSRELARTDSLTGLLNRRAFDTELAISAARAERFKRDLSLIVLDLDNFKSLNDTHGHPAGDTVLKKVAAVLLDKSRQIDLVSRIGGEEFAIILADTPPGSALRLAERLRQALAQTAVDGINFTASFGVSTTRENNEGAAANERAPEIMKAADDALYAAKKAGRNRVRYASDTSKDPSELLAALR